MDFFGTHLFILYSNLMYLIQIYFLRMTLRNWHHHCSLHERSKYFVETSLVSQNLGKVRKVKILNVEKFRRIFLTKFFNFFVSFFSEWSEIFRLENPLNFDLFVKLVKYLNIISIEEMKLIIKTIV